MKQDASRKVIMIFFGLLLISFSSMADVKVAVVGRSLDDYKKMFKLSDFGHEEQLAKKAILDVPGGPSSFIAELDNRYQLNPKTVAVDLCYHDDVGKVEMAIFRGMQQAFRPFYTGTIRQASEDSQERFANFFLKFDAVHQEFLKHYQNNKQYYQQGDIRQLNSVLNEQTFDLILSSNLLFLYGMDETFHDKAIKSLTSHLNEAGELRVTPLDTFYGKTSEYLNNIRTSLEALGFETEILDGGMPSVGQKLNKRHHERGEILVVRHKSHS